MDWIIEWITKNKEWLFSGLGITVLVGLGRLLWIRFKPRESFSQSPALPPTPVIGAPKVRPEEKSLYSPVKMERAYVVRRVNVGDFVDIPRDHGRKIRITITGLHEIEIPVGVLNQTKRENAVVIAVDLREPAYCGTDVKKTGHNRFLVPQLEGDEELKSVFCFRNSEDYTSFIRIAIEHINPSSGTVDLSVVHVVGFIR